MAMSEPKKVCNTCGGSGEIGYFKGESRFFITREECPACVGLGYVLEDLNPDENPLGPDMENRGEGE
jgi:DnaJ-class molecular chaperone